MNPFEAMAVLGTISVIGFTAYGVVRVIATSWAHKAALKTSPNEEQLMDMVDRLQSEVDTLRDELSYRMDDLEERADFSMKLLERNPGDAKPQRRSRVIGLTPI